MTDLARLTVVIANWGTPDLTIRSAKAAIADGVPAERVVVVDNGSEDDSYARFQDDLRPASSSGWRRTSASRGRPIWARGCSRATPTCS